MLKIMNKKTALGLLSIFCLFNTGCNNLEEGRNANIGHTGRNKAEAMNEAYARSHQDGIKPLQLNQVEEIVDERSAVILDARSGKWDTGERIPGAKSLNSASSAEEILKVLPDKNTKILTYCSNQKCPASKALAEKLLKMGYKNVSEYADGIQGWKEGGNRVDMIAR